MCNFSIKLPILNKSKKTEGSKCDKGHLADLNQAVAEVHIDQAWGAKAGPCCPSNK